MSPLPQTGHEHHDRIREHIDRLPGLADMLEQRPVPEDFAPRFAAECDFMTGTLLPHIAAVEENVYPQLERLQQNRHSMAHLRREHAEMNEIVEQMRGYKERMEAGPLKDRARKVADKHGLSRREVYQSALKQRKDPDL